MWEDPGNCNGGKWIVRLQKGLASRIFEVFLATAHSTFVGKSIPRKHVEKEKKKKIEHVFIIVVEFLSQDLILALIGGQFAVGDEICGCVVSIRFNEDIVSLWNKTADDRETCLQMKYERSYLHKYKFIA